MATALLTGATGGLGRSLTKLLTASGVSVRGLSTSKPHGIDAASFVEADITSLSWDGVCDGCDVVFHLAAYVHKPTLTDVDVRRAVAVNTDATRRLAETCATRGLPLVFASSVMAAMADYVAVPSPERLRDEQARWREGSRDSPVKLASATPSFVFRYCMARLVAATWGATLERHLSSTLLADCGFGCQEELPAF